MAGQGESYVTPLSRVRGMGASRTGVGGFIKERVTSIALVPLCLWAVWAALAAAPGGYEGAVALLQNPVHATFAVLLVVIGFHHTHLGMKVVIEDYVHAHGPKFAALLANSAVALLGAALAVVSILKVAVSATVPV